MREEQNKIELLDIQKLDVYKVVQYNQKVQNMHNCTTYIQYNHNAQGVPLGSFHIPFVKIVYMMEQSS